MNKGQLIFNNPDKIYSFIKKMTAKEYVDTMNLTASDIEKFCQRNELNMDNKLKDEYVEKKCNPPLMASYFYYYIYFYQKLPTQKEFRSFYARLNFDWMGKKIGRKYREPFLARLDRFYASIMRDIHYYHLAKEQSGYEIQFTLEDDIERKMDLYFEYDNQTFGIQLRVDTKDSLTYVLEKDKRTLKTIQAVLIDFPINMKEAKKVNTKKDTFYFYSEKHVEKMKKIIQEKTTL